jgi:TolB-like protein
MSRLVVVALTGVMLVTRSTRADDLPTAARKAGDALATALGSSPEAPSVRQVALLPFTEGSGASGLGPAAAALVGARLGQAAPVKVVDPDALRSSIGERKLQVMMGSGKADDPELVSKAGAQAALTGTVEVDGSRVRIVARLALLPGGKVLATAQATADAPARSAGAESGSIEVAIRKLADGLATGFGRLPGSGRYRRLAVLTFTEVGERAQKKKLGTIVTAEVATNLRRDHGLLLAERAKLGEVLSDLKLQEMTSPDASQASRIGQMADAQALVLGSVAEAGDRYLVTARIIATQTGEALAAESVSVPEAGMAAIASDAVVLRSRGDAVMRSLLFPGLGQSYNRQPVKAVAFAAAEVVLLGAALGYHLSGNAAWSDYRAVDGRGGGSPSAEATRLYDLAQSRYTTRNWLLVGGAAVWAAGLVDAWASGVDGQKLLGGGAVAGADGGPRARLVVAPAPAPAGDGMGLALAGRF